MTDPIYYPLTASQRMLHQAVTEFGSAQCLTIGVCIAVKMPVNFPLLHTCLIEEARRQECLRIKFTVPDTDGHIRQYFSDQPDPPISYLDLSGVSLEEAKVLMTEKSTQGFDEPDCSLCRFIMVSLPDSWNGVYLCIDHRIMDSCGLITMMNDVLGMYCHCLYGTPPPPMPASYEKMLLLDLEQEQNKNRQADDTAFWKEQLALGEPIYTDVTSPKKLEQCRIAHGLPDLRAADRTIIPADGDLEVFTLPPKEAARLANFCRSQSVSMTNLLLMGMRTCLSAVNDWQPDVSLRNYVSRRSSRANRTCGGCRIHCYPCRTILSPETTFLDGLKQIKTLQNRVYRHCDYDPEALSRLMSQTFAPPKLTTYESAALTYQPLPLASNNPFLAHIPLRIDWFSSKADIQKLYLTVMQSPQKDGLNFYFKYQTAELNREDVRQFYDRLIQAMSQGLKNPGQPLYSLLSELTPSC